MTAQKPLFSDAFIGRRSCLQHVTLFAAVFGSAGRFSKSQPPRRVAFSAPSSLSQRATGSSLHALTIPLNHFLAGLSKPNPFI